MSETVTVSGPIFDGRADLALNQACEESERSIGILGASMVRTELSHVLKIETPYYRMQVEARSDPPGWKIWDQDVIYGPWLEGVGSRNYPVTRFRGYSTFRRMTQAIQARAGAITERVLVSYQGRWS
jgi:hypothetical protein